MNDVINKDSTFFTDWWDQLNKPFFVSIVLLIFIWSLYKFNY
jgi:hypothetical protein